MRPAYNHCLVLYLFVGFASSTILLVVTYGRPKEKASSTEDNDWHPDEYAKGSIFEPFLKFAFIHGRKRRDSAVVRGLKRKEA